MNAILQGIAAAAPEAGGLLLTALLVALVAWLCRRHDARQARRRRRAIAAARALRDAPGWVTPEMVYVRDGRVIGARWWGRVDDAGGQLAALESMMARSRRAGVR